MAEPSGRYFLEGYRRSLSGSTTDDDSGQQAEAIKFLAEHRQVPVEGLLKLLGTGEDRANRVLGRLLEKQLAALHFEGGTSVVRLTETGLRVASQFGWIKP